MRLVLREIRLLKASVHPNVVRLHEAFRSKSGRVYMITEHVQHTLTEQLRKNPFGFSPRSVKLITWQLLQATAFLHSNKVSAYSDYSNYPAWSAIAPVPIYSPCMLRSKCNCCSDVGDFCPRPLSNAGHPP